LGGEAPAEACPAEADAEVEVVVGFEGFEEAVGLEGETEVNGYPEDVG
jgi:hypothetical protein